MNYVYQISNQSNNFNIVFWGVGKRSPRSWESRKMPQATGLTLLEYRDENKFPRRNAIDMPYMRARTLTDMHTYIYNFGGMKELYP